MENRPALRDKVGKELEGSNAKIRDLRSKIEKVGTPPKARRRAQPMLNGFGSTFSSTTNLTGPGLGVGRVNPPRQNSSERGPPKNGLSHVTSSSTLASSFTSGSRLRSHSLSDQLHRESFENHSQNEEWTYSPGEAQSDFYHDSPNDVDGGDWDPIDDEATLEALRDARAAMTKLSKIKKESSNGKWSIPLVGRLVGTIAAAAKSSPRMKLDIDFEEVVDL